MVGEVLLWFAHAIASAGDFGQWLIQHLIHLLLLSFNLMIQGLVFIVNGFISLMPDACVTLVPVPEMTAVNPNLIGTLAQALCWVLPVGFYLTLLQCMASAIILYLTMSWALRWLKIIK